MLHTVECSLRVRRSDVPPLGAWTSDPRYEGPLRVRHCRRRPCCERPTVYEDCRRLSRGDDCRWCDSYGGCYQLFSCDDAQSSRLLSRTRVHELPVCHERLEWSRTYRASFGVPGAVPRVSRGVVSALQH